MEGFILLFQNSSKKLLDLFINFNLILNRNYLIKYFLKNLYKF